MNLDQHLQHPEDESAEEALQRLKEFVAAAEELDWDDVPDVLVEEGQSAPLAEVEEQLHIQLPQSFVSLFGKIGVISIESDFLRVQFSATAEELDFDGEHGQVHDTDFYADVYGMTQETFDEEAVQERFARVSVATYWFADDDEHEDGDVAVLILDREKKGRAEVPVWEIPDDDGFPHVVRGRDAASFLSGLVDRVIRCTQRHHAR